MKYVRRNSHGFTLLELIIASTVFAVILLLVTTGIIQIGNRYYKTTIQSRTQAAARNIADEIGRGFQFSGVDPAGLGSVASAQGGFCINNVQYHFKKQTVMTESDRVFIAAPKSSTTPCNTGWSVPSGSRDLLAPGMWLKKLAITYDPVSRVARINIRIMTTPTEGFDMVVNPNGSVAGAENNPDAICSSRSSHMCAISELSTAVQKRIQ